ncbi:hypothetical protein BLNAU_11762 [Blattamonas nauphoetae]|uniref:Ubiquitin-like domain-containing protein n=1 Tax=Blattamonas nauphoetae TaxID=2049346 RepID=A0ABQ9XNH1_9EUKA|nr:hypothetical protein BLNAU_11762 [Blattamonas nauphoetae]
MYQTVNMADPNTPLTLRIKSALNAEMYDLSCALGNSVLQIKQLLIPSVNVPVQRMTIMHEAEELANDRTLMTIDFKGNFVLILFVADEEETGNTIDITLRNQTNAPALYKINPQKTIGELKEVIANREHVQSSAIRLTALGRPLDNANATIASYGIVNGSEIVFTANIIGGLSN